MKFKRTDKRCDAYRTWFAWYPKTIRDAFGRKYTVWLVRVQRCKRVNHLTHYKFRPGTEPAAP